MCAEKALRVERQNNADGAAEYLAETVKVADSLFDKGMDMLL